MTPTIMFKGIYLKVLLVIAVLLAAIAGDLAWERSRQTAAEKQYDDFWKQVDHYKKTERYDWSGK